MTMTSTTSGATQRPKKSSAYLAASALYNAGFRGWPLVVMTAIGGQQSNWNPTALNNNPSTGDYSVGIWQINYFGDLLSSRTKSFGSPAYLRSTPQAQADATYQLAGGNQLVGLSNWALSPSPQNGTTPSPTQGGASIASYIPAAATAAAQVGEFGPASANQIAQASAWPGSTPLGTALAGPGTDSGSQVANGSTAGSGGAGELQGCAAKTNADGSNNVFSADLKVTSLNLTYCELKALVGGLCLAAGGTLMVLGLISLVSGSKTVRSSVAVFAPVAAVSRKVKSRGASADSEESESQEEAA